MPPLIKQLAASQVRPFSFSVPMKASISQSVMPLTVLMPIFKVTGSIFLISAVVLGLWLLHSAYRVLRDGGNKNAHLMYRYSSMYLAFIFLAMVIDALA